MVQLVNLKTLKAKFTHLILKQLVKLIEIETEKV